MRNLIFVLVLFKINAVLKFYCFRAVKNFWPKDIFEYFNVDSSAHMNDLSLILLKGGTGVGEDNINGVYYRQFLPATNVIF